MKIVLRTLFILLCMVFTWMMTARAQLTGWQYASVIEITEQQGNAYTDYQLLLTINTADLVANGMMQANGGDLRFALDCEGMTLIPFFIDTANSTLPGNTFPGSATKIWVRIPQILPFNVTKIYLFSGNSSAVSLNDFTSTFPNSLIIPTATSTTLFGTLDYDWFEVEAGATVNLLAGTPLVINSDKIKIDGIINGSGAGFAGGLSGGLNGSGPGGGVGSPSAGDGAGGGAYHGNGGNGGFNSLLFTGGSSYGSLFSVTINMGSGGGGGIDSTGGNGGGAVTFSGGDVEISGDINMSGANGRIDTASLQGTGGGAGGGILITGRFINYSGNTSVAGGDGGSDPSLNPAVGGGGGGGGGRVKAFYYNSGNVTAAIDVSGGTGGCCGAAASQNGQPGATWQEKLDDIYSITVNPMIFRQSPIVSGEDSACVGSSELYTASVVAGNTYLWTVTGGNVVSGQSTNSAEVNWIAAGSQTVTLITTNAFLGCSDTILYNVEVSSEFPVSNFTFGPACENTVTQFTNTSAIGPSAGIVSYFWDFDDGNISTTQDPAHTFLSSGTYNVTLQAMSNFGCTGSITLAVTVDAFPDASFTADTVCLGTSTTFSGTAGAASYDWDFGDGVTGSGLAITHAYTAPGTFIASLDVTSANGCVSSSQLAVSVNPLPLVNFDFVDACPNDNVVFTNTSSISSGTLSYFWDFGDGNTSVASAPLHAYASSGSYAVTLTATSGAGCAASVTKSVTVYPSPLVNFSAGAVCLGTPADFFNFSSIASGFLIYSWDFGDFSPVSNVQNPSHTYSTFGTFTVTLAATSDKGCTGSFSMNVDVYTQPTASFSVTEACFGDSTLFSNTSSSGAGITYFWDFGDGNFSGGTNPKHLYSLPGTYTAVLTVTTSNGCIAAAQQDVFVHPKPVANFSAPNVCEGKSTQFVNTSSISGGSMNFNWDFGDGNTSALDNPLHTYADTGSFTVALGVVSDQGCTDTVIKTVTVLLQPFADFSIQPACFGSDNVIVDLSTGYEAGAFYQVDIFNDNSYDAGPFPPGNSSINVGSAGSFFAKIRITNLNGCRDSVVEAFTVNSFPVAGFASNDVCFGESITFLNTTTSVDPNLLGALSYQWDFGDGNASIDINPTHAYDTSGIFTVTLIALSSAGCSDTFSNTLIVYPLPVADFTSNVACFNQNVNFTNLSTISFGTMTFLWEFGDNDTSTATNPTHVYTSIGIYQMRLTATSDAGCVTIITRSLIVYPTPAANFIATNVCENEANEFTNLSSIASGTLTYLWDFGDSFNSINEDPEHTYAGDGSYTVTLTATSNVGCTATDTRTVEVYDKPAVSFSANSACFGDTTFFTNNSTLNGGTIVLYNWNFGDGSNSLDVNPWHIYNATGTYKVKLTLTSDKGCVKTDSAAVVVNKIPEVFISHNTPLAFCDGGDVTLTALAFPPPPISSYSYQWSTNETDSFLAVTSTGIYCVSVTDQNGCAADTCELVTVWDLPSVTASSSDDTVSKGYPVQLSATGAQTYQWSADPPDATLNANDQNPIVTPMVTTTYTVAGTDANGCMDTATVTVIVVDDYFVHPANVITPNGDAYNQYWFIENILTYPDNEVLIFDRWGTLVFQAKAYDNTWEGTKDDKALPQGTYYYVIRFDGTDMIYKGSVSIIR